MKLSHVLTADNWVWWVISNDGTTQILDHHRLLFTDECTL